MRSPVRDPAAFAAAFLVLVAMGSCEPVPPSEPAFRDYSVRQVTLGSSNDGDALEVAYIGPDFFPSFPEAVVLFGRPLGADDFRPDAIPVAVLGHDFWSSRFGADPNALGRSIVLDGVEHIVVGVIGQGPAGPNGAVLFVPGDPRLDVATPSGMAEAEVLSALGSCFGNAALPADGVIEEVRNSGSPPELHLIRYGLEPGEDGTEYVAAVEDEAGGCRIELLPLRTPSDAFFYPLRVSAQGVPVVQAQEDMGGTDAKWLQTETYLVLGGGRVERVGDGKRMAFLPGDSLLYDMRQILDPATRESLALEALGEGEVFDVLPRDARSVLVLRCQNPLCMGRVDDTEPGGWAQVIGWQQGVLAEIPYGGFYEQLNYEALVHEADGFIALLDHRAGTLWVLPKGGPAAFIEYALADLPAQSADAPGPSISFEYEVYEDGSYFTVKHELSFTPEGEPLSYRVTTGG